MQGDSSAPSRTSLVLHLQVHACAWVITLSVTSMSVNHCCVRTGFAYTFVCAPIVHCRFHPFTCRLV